MIVTVCWLPRQTDCIFISQTKLGLAGFMAQLLSACSHMHTYNERMSGEETDKYTKDTHAVCLQRRERRNK